MAKFVSKEPVGVTIEGDPNTIYIRPKMSYGLVNSVRSKAARMVNKSDGMEQSLDIGLWNVELAVANIVKWEGPEFDHVPLTRENIEQLDPDDPLLDAVLAKIQELNFQKDEAATDPNLPTPKSSSDLTKKRAAPESVKGQSGSGE